MPLTHHTQATTDTGHHLQRLHLLTTMLSGHHQVLHLLTTSLGLLIHPPTNTTKPAHSNGLHPQGSRLPTIDLLKMHPSHLQYLEA